MDNEYKDNKLFIDLYLDVRRKRKKDKLYPLRVRLRFNGKTNFYTTGLYYEKEVYQKIKKGKRLTIEEQNEKEKIDAVLKRAKTVAKNPFSFEHFKRAWYNKGGKIDVFDFFQRKIDGLRAEETFSTADLYNNSLNALKNFHKESILHFDNVTPEYLRLLVSWLQSAEENKSPTTVSMYLRCLKTIFNDARRQNDTKNYPFFNQLSNPYGYKIPAPKKGKQSLTANELEILKQYQPSKTEQFWYDMFMFSYHAGGLNIKDIALLENKNLINNKIRFIRAKTGGNNPVERHASVAKPILRTIIDRWRTNGKYIFPLIEENMDPEDRHKTIKSKTRNINKVMKSIASKLNIETPVSTYTARHTFASNMSQMGAPIALISESLHHTNIKTTQNYLASFPDEEKEKWFEKL